MEDDRQAEAQERDRPIEYENKRAEADDCGSRYIAQFKNGRDNDHD